NTHATRRRPACRRVPPAGSPKRSHTAPQVGSCLVSSTPPTIALAALLGLARWCQSHRAHQGGTPCDDPKVLQRSPQLPLAPPASAEVAFLPDRLRCVGPTQVARITLVTSVDVTAAHKVLAMMQVRPQPSWRDGLGPSPSCEPTADR